MVKQEERNNSNRLRGIEIESYRSMGWWQESFKSTKRNYLFNLDNRRGEKKLIKTLYKLISRELRREFVWQGPTIYIPLLAFDSSRIPLKEKGRKGREERSRGDFQRDQRKWCAALHPFSLHLRFEYWSKSKGRVSNVGWVIPNS